MPVLIGVTALIISLSTLGLVGTAALIVIGCGIMFIVMNW